jgi:hypothetical protein
MGFLEGPLAYARGYKSRSLTSTDGFAVVAWANNLGRWAARGRTPRTHGWVPAARW